MSKLYEHTLIHTCIASLLAHCLYLNTGRQISQSSLDYHQLFGSVTQNL